MKINLNLNANDILNKEFLIDLKGYQIRDVDYFLDVVKKDYSNWEMIIKEWQEHVRTEKKTKEDLVHKLEICENHIKKLKKEIQILQTNNQGNIDIISRLNKLEEKK